MKFSTEFDEYQKEEFNKAEMFDGSSEEIRKHPEWSHNFMNAFWNAEKNGNAQNIYEIADYMTEHPAWKDMDAGKLGTDFEYLSALHEYVNSKAMGAVGIPEIPINDEGYVDVGKAVFMLETEKLKYGDDIRPLFTSRMPIRDGMHDSTRKILMCEGNEQAKTIYDQMRGIAGSESRTDNLFGSNPNAQQWNKLSVVFDADDMNIRGQQLVDAFEYAGTTQTLVDKLMARDSEMVDYVNKKTAERYLDNINKEQILFGESYPLAKTGGASFAHDGGFIIMPDRNWDINIRNAEELASANVKPLTVDYSTLDITEGVDKETAFKIIEAHGFEPYFRREIKPGAFGDVREAAFFYNKHNGDIISVDGATSDNAVYSGVTLKSWRCMEDWYRGGHHGSSGFNHDAELGHTEVTYHNGLFKQYANFTDAPVSKQENRDEIGYWGIGEFPIPDYVDIYAGRGNDSKIKDPHNYQAICGSSNYELSTMINMMLTAYDPEMHDNVCPDYKRLKEDPYHTIMKNCAMGYFQADTQERARQFQLAASYLHMPTEERQKYYEALVDCAAEHDEKYKQRIKDTDQRMDKERILGKCVAKLSKTYLQDPKCPDDLYVSDIAKIEDTPYKDFVPWLGDDLDFDKAVASISQEEGVSL